MLMTLTWRQAFRGGEIRSHTGRARKTFRYDWIERTDAPAQARAGGCDRSFVISFTTVVTSVNRRSMHPLSVRTPAPVFRTGAFLRGCVKTRDEPMGRHADAPEEGQFIMNREAHVSRSVKARSFERACMRELTFDGLT